MAQFTLDDIRSAAEAKYSSTEIDLGDGVTVSLVNVLRLPKEKRTELQSIQQQLSPEEGEDAGLDADQEGLLEAALRCVAKTETQGEKIVEALGGDLTLLMEVFTRYVEGTQVGEASPSAA